MNTFKKYLLAVLLLGVAQFSFAQGCLPGPAVYESIPEGHWEEVSCNTLDDIDPCPTGDCVYSGQGNSIDQAAVVSTWNGGAFADDHGALGTYIAYGGGHKAYHGSEVYEFDVFDRTWTRSEPSTAMPVNTTYGEWADGDPLAPHTYNRVGYHPNVGAEGAFFVIGTNVDLQCGCYTPWIHYFDLVTQQWSRGDSIPSKRGTMVFDDARSHFVYVPDGGIGYSIYDPLAATLNERITTFSQASPGISLDQAGAIEPNHDVLVILDYYRQIANKRMRVLDLKNPSSNFVDVSEIAQGMQLPHTDRMGFEYVAAANDGAGAFYAYAGQGQSYLYKLTPPDADEDWQTSDWVWSRENALGGITPQAMDAGSEGRIYSRFQWVESVGVFLLVQRTVGPVYAYKPIGGTPPPPIPDEPSVSLISSEITVISGASVELSWGSTNADSCSASGDWSGDKAITGSETVGPLTTESSFVITCIGNGGSDSDSVAVSVTAPPPVPEPSITLSAEPTSVTVGGSTTLTWSSENASSCMASGDWSGSKNFNGSEVQSNLVQDAVFTLTCDNGSAGAAATVNVNVVATPVPTVELIATPHTVAEGESAVLTWSTTNAESCLASNGWSGARATSEAVGESTPPLVHDTVYTLTCEGPGGSGFDNALVVMLNIDNDSDQDGLLDQWEQENFGSLDETADGDADGDGVSNLEEFLANTNPTDVLAETEGEGSGAGWFSLLLLIALLTRAKSHRLHR